MTNELISTNPEIMSGAACFRGTRVPVQNLFDYLEGNFLLDDFLEDFPSVSREVAVGTLEAARVSLIGTRKAEFLTPKRTAVPLTVGSVLLPP